MEFPTHHGFYEQLHRNTFVLHREDGSVASPTVPASSQRRVIFESVMKRFVTVSPAMEATSLHHFCLDSAIGTPAEQLSDSEEEDRSYQNFPSKAAPAPQEKTEEPKAEPAAADTRVTACANNMATLFRQSFCNTCVAFGSAVGEKCQPSSVPGDESFAFSSFVENDVKPLMARVWDGEDVCFVESDATGGTIQPSLAVQSVGDQTSLLRWMLSAVREEARKRGLVDGYTVSVHGCAATIEAGPAGAQPPKVVDLFDFMGVPEGVPYSSPEPEIQPPLTALYTYGSMYGKYPDEPRRRSDSGVSASAAFSRTGSMRQSRHGSLSRQGSLSRHNTADGDERRLSFRRNSSLRGSRTRRSSMLHDGGPCVADILKHGVTTSPAPEVAAGQEVIANHIEAGPVYAVKNLRLLQLNQEETSDYFAYRLEDCGFPPDAHSVMSIIITQNSPVSGTKVSALRWVHLATSTANEAVTPADRQLTCDWMANAIGSSVTQRLSEMKLGERVPRLLKTIPPRWLGHPGLFHVLESLLRGPRLSHAVSVVHAPETKTFTALPTLAAGGRFAMDVMIAETHLDIQDALKALLADRDKLEADAERMADELGELMRNHESQTKSLELKERRHSSQFEQSFRRGANNMLDTQDKTTFDGMTDESSQLLAEFLGAKQVEEEGDDEDGPASLQETARRRSRIVEFTSSTKHSTKDLGEDRRRSLMEFDASDRKRLEEFFGDDVTLISNALLSEAIGLLTKRLHASGVSTKHRTALESQVVNAEHQLALAKEKLAHVEDHVEEDRAKLADGEANLPCELRRLEAALERDFQTVESASQHVPRPPKRTSIGSTNSDHEGGDKEERKRRADQFVRKNTALWASSKAPEQALAAETSERTFLQGRIDAAEAEIADLQKSIAEAEDSAMRVQFPRLAYLYEYSAVLRQVLACHRRANPALEKAYGEGRFFNPGTFPPREQHVFDLNPLQTLAKGDTHGDHDKSRLLSILRCGALAAESSEEPWPGLYEAAADSDAKFRHWGVTTFDAKAVDQSSLLAQSSERTFSDACEQTQPMAAPPPPRSVADGVPGVSSKELKEKVTAVQTARARMRRAAPIS